jgi:hydrogenase-4 component E
MTTSVYTNLLYLAVGTQLLCAVGVVWRRQLGASVRLLAAQGAALAAIPLLGGIYHDEAHLVAIAPVILFLRAAALPWLISRMVPRLVRPAGGWTATAGVPAPTGGTTSGQAGAVGNAGTVGGTGEVGEAAAATLDVFAETREPTPLVSTSVSLLLSAALTVLAYAVCRPLIALAPSPGTHAAPAALALILIGVLALTTRRRAVSQVVGFLTLDNGITALAFLLTSGVPTLVELGASLDLLLAVLVATALTTRMRAVFGGTDLGELSELKE